MEASYLRARTTCPKNRGMSISTQQLLDACEAAILKRLNGDAYEAYREGDESFTGASIESLMESRRTLQEQLAAENGSSFTLAEPFFDA